MKHPTTWLLLSTALLPLVCTLRYNVVQIPSETVAVLNPLEVGYYSFIFCDACDLSMDLSIDCDAISLNYAFDGAPGASSHPPGVYNEMRGYADTLWSWTENGSLCAETMTRVWNGNGHDRNYRIITIKLAIRLANQTETFNVELLQEPVPSTPSSMVCPFTTPPQVVTDAASAADLKGGGIASIILALTTIALIIVVILLGLIIAYIKNNEVRDMEQNPPLARRPRRDSNIENRLRAGEVPPLQN